jgi:type II secretory ATPase GspE/PulE/Tfp pilus assembly ATPase PilB-like protein
MTETAQPHPQSLDDLWFLLQHSRGTGEPRLGMALVARGLLDQGLLERALTAQRLSRPRQLLGQMLVEAGVLSQAQLQQAMADWLGAIFVDPMRLQPQPAAVAKVPRALAERESVLPLLLRDETLVVALPDPWDKGLIDELRFLTDLKVRAVGAVPGTLPAAVSRAYRPRPSASTAQAAAPDPAPPQASAPRRDLHSLAAELSAHAAADIVHDPDVNSESENTLVRLVNRLIAEAMEHGASDIHIETAEPPRPVRIRMRIDGELVPWLELPAQVRYALVARLKIMADLDIAEHRKPQDGKIDFARHGGRPMELRVVIVPTARGLEDVVLRLLNSLEPLPLDRIGLLPDNLETLREVMTKAYGLVLICGPTGCGKTTTLHSVMRELNVEKRKIWTAEDPIEITQPGLRQVQVNPRIGWTFAAAMRTFLRADPDVIMIGEMRDEETARIAVEASLTGHLVMSTLHTNSAPESITRLLEIGLDPFMFSDSLLAVLAQRLVRRLCPNCRVAEPMTADTLEALVHQHVSSATGSSAEAALDRLELVDRWRRRYGGPDAALQQWRRVGCPACENSGYHGRMGLHELLVVDEHLRSLIRRRAAAAELQTAGFAGGMATLRQDGIEKVLAGDTDLAEVLAATNQ